MMIPTVPPAAAVAALGFITTLNVINVDGFIVRQNFNRAQRGEQMDIAHLASLSEDIVPILAEQYNLSLETGELEEEITGLIACHAELNRQYDYQNHPYREYTWQSFHLSRYTAHRDWQALTEFAGENQFEVYHDEGNGDIFVLINDEEISCWTYYYD